METLWAPWRHAYITGEAERGRRKGVPARLAGWPGPETGCIFCNLLGAVRWAVAEGMASEEAERNAGIVRLGTSTWVCLNAFPYTSGHVMILPYAHEASLAALPQETAEEIMRTAQEMEEVLRAVYRPDGLNLGMNLGEAAGAGIASHLHMHVLPRWAGDTNFMTAVAGTRVLPEALDVTWERVRSMLTSGTTPPAPTNSNAK